MLTPEAAGTCVMSMTSRFDSKGGEQNVGVGDGTSGYITDDAIKRKEVIWNSSSTYCSI